MCVGSEFQVDCAETENDREAKLLVMPEGLARRFVLEERKEDSGRLVRTGKEDGRHAIRALKKTQSTDPASGLHVFVHSSSTTGAPDRMGVAAFTPDIRRNEQIEVNETIRCKA